LALSLLELIYVCVQLYDVHACSVCVWVGREWCAWWICLLQALLLFL